MREVSGKQKENFVCMLYGQPGVGKTTFASFAPSPVFIGDEENKEIDAKKIIIDKFSELTQALQLIQSDKYKDCKTIVIDSISSLEDKLTREVIASDKNAKATSTIHSVHTGYGRGVDIMVNKTIPVLQVLQKLSNIHNIIVLCHSQKDTEEDPTLLKTNTFYRPSLQKKTLRIWEKWLPVILFARDKVILDSDTEKTKSLLDRRVLYTEYRASHYAKNRYGFKYEIDFTPRVVLELIALKDKFYTNAKQTKKPSINIEELKAIYNRIPEKIQPDIDWALINKGNYEKCKSKLMELAE